MYTVKGYYQISILTHKYHNEYLVESIRGKDQNIKDMFDGPKIKRLVVPRSDGRTLRRVSRIYRGHDTHHNRQIKRRQFTTSWKKWSFILSKESRHLHLSRKLQRSLNKDSPKHNKIYQKILKEDTKVNGFLYPIIKKNSILKWSILKNSKLHTETE